MDTASLGVGAPHYWTMGISFAAAPLPGITEFATLFDYYSIRKVVVKFSAFSNVANVPGAQSGQSPQVYYYIDHDDNQVPVPTGAGLQEFRQRHNLKTARMFRPLRIVIKPRCLVNVRSLQEGPVTVASSAMIFRPKRLDVADLQVPHYGLKLFFAGIDPGFASFFSFQAEVIYYVKFSGVR